MSTKSSDNSRDDIRLSEVVSALSYALDLTEGQPIGHAVKSCVLGMRIADEMGLPIETKADLYYACLLKDLGCSSNAARVHEIFGGDERNAKRDLKTTDWTRLLEGFAYVRKHAAIGQSLFQRFLRIVKIASGGGKQARQLVQIRCERGCDIAQEIGFSKDVGKAIYHLDEHWNGAGHPDGLKGEEIPLLARILSVSQTLEVFQAAENAACALAIIKERSGRWFDPEVVRAACALASDQSLWEILQNKSDGAARSLAMDLEPASRTLSVRGDQLTKICEGFAAVIDAKSPWTFQHSLGVTKAAVGMAERLQFAPAEIQTIRHASLLHDIGKLSVPNSILDKPSKLTDAEFDAVRLHPFYTERILQKIGAFDNLAFLASAHHERLDGSGYHNGLTAEQLPLSARIIAVADVYDALSAERPYREALPLDRVLSIIKEDTPHALCPQCYESLTVWANAQ